MLVFVQSMIIMMLYKVKVIVYLLVIMIKWSTEIKQKLLVWLFIFYLRWLKKRPSFLKLGWLFIHFMDFKSDHDFIGGVWSIEINHLIVKTRLDDQTLLFLLFHLIFGFFILDQSKNMIENLSLIIRLDYGYWLVIGPLFKFLNFFLLAFLNKRVLNRKNDA